MDTGVVVLAKYGNAWEGDVWHTAQTATWNRIGQRH